VKATPEEILRAAERELRLAIRDLIACRNRLYREHGAYPSSLAAAIGRVEFAARHLLTGLVSPSTIDAKPKPARPDAPAAKPARVN
jgi:hypothetical protein